MSSPITFKKRFKTEAGRNATEFFVYTCDVPEDGLLHVLTLLPPALVDEAFGIPGSAIIGFLDDPDRVAFEGFRRNKAFARLFQRVVARTIPTLPDAQQAAIRKGNGLVEVVDPRTAPGSSPVPRADVCGVFTIVDGRFDSSTYTPNDEYCMMSEDGTMFHMDPEVREAVMVELHKQFKKAPSANHNAM